eukprot:comp21883_c0_seq1/m.49604 comp21883_c0_seq1/g.49604  ORF comp21883_c0_seq1/g.49604 comp21883_c0_seq1/m.49604 type:complete len:368 (-) comp21883_c0_seq1:80-1183(-)
MAPLPPILLTCHSPSICRMSTCPSFALRSSTQWRHILSSSCCLCPRFSSSCSSLAPWCATLSDPHSNSSSRTTTTLDCSRIAICSPRRQWRETTRAPRAKRPPSAMEAIWRAQRATRPTTPMPPRDQLQLQRKLQRMLQRMFQRMLQRSPKEKTAKPTNPMHPQPRASRRPPKQRQRNRRRDQALHRPQLNPKRLLRLRLSRHPTRLRLPHLPLRRSHLLLPCKTLRVMRARQRGGTRWRSLVSLSIAGAYSSAPRSLKCSISVQHPLLCTTLTKTAWKTIFSHMQRISAGSSASNSRPIQITRMPLGASRTSFRPCSLRQAAEPRSTLVPRLQFICSSNSNSNAIRTNSIFLRGCFMARQLGRLSR